MSYSIEDYHRFIGQTGPDRFRLAQLALGIPCTGCGRPRLAPCISPLGIEMYGQVCQDRADALHAA